MIYFKLREGVANRPTPYKRLALLIESCNVALEGVKVADVKRRLDDNDAEWLIKCVQAGCKVTIKQ